MTDKINISNSTLFETILNLRKFIPYENFNNYNYNDDYTKRYDTKNYFASLVYLLNQYKFSDYDTFFEKCIKNGTIKSINNKTINLDLFVEDIDNKKEWSSETYYYNDFFKDKYIKNILKFEKDEYWYFEMYTKLIKTYNKGFNIEGLDKLFVEMFSMLSILNESDETEDVKYVSIFTSRFLNFTVGYLRGKRFMDFENKNIIRIQNDLMLIKTKSIFKNNLISMKNNVLYIHENHITPESLSYLKKEHYIKTKDIYEGIFIDSHHKYLKSKSDESIHGYVEKNMLNNIINNTPLQII